MRWVCTEGAKRAPPCPQDISSITEDGLLLAKPEHLSKEARVSFHFPEPFPSFLPFSKLSCTPAAPLALVTGHTDQLWVPPPPPGTVLHPEQLEDYPPTALKLTSCTQKPMCHGVQFKVISAKQAADFSLLINLPHLPNGTRQTVMP